MDKWGWILVAGCGQPCTARVWTAALLVAVAIAGHGCSEEEGSLHLPPLEVQSSIVIPAAVQNIKALVETSDGLLVAGGANRDEESDGKPYDLKFSGTLGALERQSGEWKWVRTISTPDLPSGQEHSNDLVGLEATEDGGVVALFSDWDYDAGGYLSNLLVKLDRDGTVLWTVDFGGQDFRHAESLAIRDSGLFLAAGTQGSTIWFASVSDDGVSSPIRELDVGVPEGDFLGRAHILETSADGVLLTAAFEETILLVKADDDGKELWSGSVVSGIPMFGLSYARPWPSGGFILAGSTPGDDWKDRIGLLRIDGEGKVVERRVWGFPGNNYTRPTSFLLTPDGELLVAGKKVHFHYEIYDGTDTRFEDSFVDFLAAFDESGRNMWSLVSPDAPWVAAMGASSDGSIVAITNYPEPELFTLAYPADASTTE